MKQKELNELVDIRNKILEVDYEDKEADVLAEKIFNTIKENFDELPVDFIIETLTKLGQAPNVIYDDNGNFAVSGDGYQPVVVDDEKISGGFTVFVEAEQWKETIRLALKHYINEQD